MKRRQFLSATAASTGLAVAAGVTAACGTQLLVPYPAPAAPAQSPAVSPPTVIGQSSPTIDWQMATSWTPTLDVIFGTTQSIAARVSALTGGNFKITSHAAGDLAPATGVLDAVSQGKVPIGHTSMYYYIAKSPVLAFGTALPFGLTAQQQNAWLFDGGGLKLLQDFMGKNYNIIQFPAGNTGAQMGGWFRKPINSVADLKGLKMRIPGLGGQVMGMLGVSAQTLGGADILPALQAGTIDAAEWVGPYDDQILGLNKVANNYYYPGWWEPGPTVELEVNLNAWNQLPPAYQAALTSAASAANVEMLSMYEARNEAALVNLVAGGVNLQPFTQDILTAANTAWNQLSSDLSSKDADFKAIFDQWAKFRDAVRAWNKINEASFTNFVYA